VAAEFKELIDEGARQGRDVSDTLSSRAVVDAKKEAVATRNLRTLHKS
jgi:hypothetical protein